MTQTVLLGDICKKIDYGFTASADFSIASPKFLRITDIKGGYIDWRTVPGCDIDAASIEKKRLHKGDIVIARTGNSTGENAYIKEDVDAVFASFLIRFQPDEDKVYPPFLRYVLRSTRWFDFSKSLAHAKSAQPGANAKELSSFRFTLPAMEAQIFYGDMFSEIDEKIELNRKMNETLEQMGQALFRHYFIDNPEAEKWGKGSLYDIANVINGAPFSSKLFNELGNGKPLIRIRDLKSQEPKIWTTEEHRKGRLVEPGDIIAGMDAEFRPIVWARDNAWLNQRVCMFEPKGANVSKTFLLETIRPQLAFYENTKIGTTVIHLSKTDIDKFTYTVAPEVIMAEFKECTDPLFDQRVINARQIQTLTTLRDTLLPRLINGKVKL